MTNLHTRAADMLTTEQLLKEARDLLWDRLDDDYSIDLRDRIDDHLAELRAAGEAQPVANGERLIEVGPSFDALLTALDRASDKGYLPDAIAGEWEAFDYSPVHVAPAPAQPTSDAQPVAWRYRDYVSGCWFVSAEPYPAGSIAGESMPLYLAPAPAQPRQPLSEWIACSDRLPKHGQLVALYGPCEFSYHCQFYRDNPHVGSEWRQRGITHWHALAELPVERAITGDKP